MPVFTFRGNLVGAVAGVTDDDSGGVNLELDESRALSGGNPWYSSTDVIEINIPGSDIGLNGEFNTLLGNEVKANWIKVNGEKITSGKPVIKIGRGSDPYDSDAFFYVEGIDLVFVAPAAGITFDETDTSGSPPVLNVPERVADFDMNADGDTFDLGEGGNGVFNIVASGYDQLPEGLTEIISLNDHSNTTAGTDANELIFSEGGDDLVSGEGGSDSMFGGEGNDTLYGDAGEGIANGFDTTPLMTRIENLESKSYVGTDASAGDSAVYRDVGQLDDGTSVWGRIVLVSKSDPSMLVDLAGGAGYEIFLFGNGTGDVATFRFEFFDPATGDPIALNGIACFNDLDANAANDAEAVILQSSSFTEFSTSLTTSLDVSQTASEIRAVGTGDNQPDNEDAWFSAMFEDRTFLEFSLESRSTGSGFTFSGDLISDPDTTVIEDGDDTLDGGIGDDIIYGQGGHDSILGGEGNDSVMGGSGNDTVLGGLGADTIFGGDGDDYIEGGEGDDFLSTGLGTDTLIGGEGDDTLQNSAGDDSLVGGVGNDSIIATQGDDTLEGGDGEDTLIGGRDDDSIDGGDGDDSILAGPGDDFVTGGAGADTLIGGDAVAGDGARLGFKWSDIADPDDGGVIDDGDQIGSGVQSVGRVDVTYSVSPGIGRFENESQYVSGIDDGADTIDSNSALAISDSGSVQLDFSEAVQNLEFRINNFDASNENLVIRAYDAGNNPIQFNATQGSNVVGSDTDGVAGNDEFEGAGGEFDDIDPEGSLFIQIPGPVARIEMDFTSVSNWTLAFTDVFFDDPLSDAQDGGDDTLDGGEGDDFIDGGVGDDNLSGGEGDDTFVYDPGDGNDTITDFNFGNTGTLSDGDNTNNDFVDLSAFYDRIGELYADQADDGILNQSNDGVNGVDYSDNASFGAGSLTFSGASADNSSFTSENTGVVCFTSGTAILTPSGRVIIDDLRVGDLVSTMDNGPQPIRWIGRRHIDKDALSLDPKLRPILIPQGTFGAERPFLVSRQHAILINPDQMARAIHLTDVAGLQMRVANGKKQVVYIHLMFEAHQVIFAEGVPSESFYPGSQSIEMLDAYARRDFLRGCPDIASAKSAKDIVEIYSKTARSIVSRKDVAERRATIQSN